MFFNVPSNCLSLQHLIILLPKIFACFSSLYDPFKTQETVEEIKGYYKIAYPISKVTFIFPSSLVKGLLCFSSWI